MQGYIMFYSEVKFLAYVLDEIKSNIKSGPKLRQQNLLAVALAASNGNAGFLTEGLWRFTSVPPGKTYGASPMASSTSFQHTLQVEISRHFAQLSTT
jgi:hypothetical protein